MPPLKQVTVEDDATSIAFIYLCNLLNTAY